MTLRRLAHALAVALSAASPSILAADIVLTPPAGGGVAVTNAAGNTTRLRVADDGTFTLPGLASVPLPATGLCVEIATGKVGTCSVGTVTSIAAGTGLTGGTITGTGTLGLAATQLLPTSPCAPNQVTKWSGSAWICAADNVGAANAFAQGGNAFGATATLGTTDNQAVEFVANSLVALRITPNAASPNLVGGHSGNSVIAGAAAAVVAGGGAAGVNDPVTFDACGATCANRVTDHGGTVGGGVGNQAGDGAGDATDRAFATVSGGVRNLASGVFSSVGGGRSNTASGHSSTAGGGSSNTASGGSSTVGGGNANAATTTYSTVGGGFSNTASNANSTVGGGTNNAAVGPSSAVLGGNANTASGDSSTVGGGNANTASGGLYSTVGGGSGNQAASNSSTVGGGYVNAANGDAGTVGGGAFNTAAGVGAMVPGGYNNSATGNYSFAAGRRAKANNPGCFSWADSTDADLPCTTDNAFVARASGGVYFFTSANLSTGAQLPIGGGSWASLSDVNAKSDFAPVDARAVLAKLVALPIASWRYKAQDPSIRHIGPTAQDFHSAFAVGESRRMITTVDADGVALAAIQGLYQMLTEKDRRIEGLEARAARVDAVERELAAIKQKLGLR